MSKAVSVYKKANQTLILAIALHPIIYLSKIPANL